MQVKLFVEEFAKKSICGRPVGGFVEVFAHCEIAQWFVDKIVRGLLGKVAAIFVRGFVARFVVLKFFFAINSISIRACLLKVESCLQIL